jgi:hypothetical protein
MTREERYRREADARAKVGAGPVDDPDLSPPQNEWHRRQAIRREAVDVLVEWVGIDRLQAENVVEAIVEGDVPRIRIEWE